MRLSRLHTPCWSQRSLWIHGVVFMSAFCLSDTNVSHAKTKAKMSALAGITGTQHVHVAVEQIQESLWQRKSPWTAAEAEPCNQCFRHRRNNVWKDREQLTINRGESGERALARANPSRTGRDLGETGGRKEEDCNAIILQSRLLLIDVFVCLFWGRGVTPWPVT